MPSHWTRALAPHTRTDAQRLGRELVSQVVDLHRSERGYEARVAGERVRLEVGERRWGIDCSCDLHRRLGEPCRHLWAMVLRLESEGTPQPPLPAGDPVALVGASGSGSRRTWKRLEAVRRDAAGRGEGRPPSVTRQIRYRLEIEGGGEVVLRLATRRRRKDGSWGRDRSARLSVPIVRELSDEIDRGILALLDGAGSADTLPSRFVLGVDHQRILLPRLAASGRAVLSDEAGDVLSWDGDEPWELRFGLVAVTRGYRLDGSFVRSAERLALDDPDRVLDAGFLLRGLELGPARLLGAGALVDSLRRDGPMQIASDEIDRFLEEIAFLPELPPLELPEGYEWESDPTDPQPVLLLRAAADREETEAILVFEYPGATLFAGSPGAAVYHRETRSLLRRDRDFESRALDRLLRLGLRNRASDPRRPRLLLPAEGCWDVFETLLGEGWRVEENGRAYRRSESLALDLRACDRGFELSGGALFGELGADWGAVAEAVRKGERVVSLDDGSKGLVPASWLRRFRPLVRLGTAERNKLTFTSSQIALLDSTLEDRSVRWDREARKLRGRIRSFEGVRPVDPPAGFVGTLRPYQKEGLGWLASLEELGFGGCLADDMGLGKTVQVLAHLVARRERTADRPRLPILVVMPRSLTFNWQNEASRFAPGLTVSLHVGAERARELEPLAGADLILTTYGTLRRDIELLRQLELDYLVLDEAQAIKNPRTATARAVRTLSSRHRLALSGTPIENHLGELWSLLDFLNPGLLGRQSSFRSLDSRSEEQLDEVARAVRPFFLRRTKGEVAHDLPPRLEQVLYCELDERGERRYRRLVEHWRERVLESFGNGSGPATLLEALLRLRQAACHPGLLDSRLRSEDSGKLEILVPRLEELVEEGHKALVFSQFTSFLDLLEDRLEAAGLTRARLDGQTRDRDEPVRRFQEDPDCPLLLVSLRAGGLGLNLTAADYVFLLDPWWNPAVEDQAIDRAHRIGRTRQVVAYRLVTRGTLEERILALQERKKVLAETILAGGGSLTREELEALLV